MGQVPNDILAVLRRAGLLDFGDEPEGEPLTGGVSSDIWLVRLAERSVCVKRALAQLRVKADWRAPVERSGYEAAWMRIAGRIVPGAVPELLYEDRAAGAVVMAYLDPGSHRLWKEALRQGEAEPQVAAAVGDRLGRIHAATARRPDIAAQFPTDAIFHDIRLEPYLLATARAHPGLASRLAPGGTAHGHDQARPGPWRRQPEEHPARPRRPGLPRRGVRLVRRSRLRPRLLPQPSPAQVPVDARGRAGFPRLLRCAGAQSYLERGRLGAARPSSRRARRACCPACSWPGSTASRRSST